MNAPAKLDALTGLRFAAAFWVFCRHVTTTDTAPIGLQGASAAIAEFLRQGYLGVAFFFVLSGFVLSYNYAERFESLTLLGIRKFYRARFARVYPVHLLTLLLIAPAMWFVVGSLGEFAVAFVAQVALVQAFIPVNFEVFLLGFNAPSWTLCAEFFFYASFPLLVFGLNARPFRNRPRRLLYPAVVAWLTVFIIAATATGNMDANERWFYFNFFPVTRIMDFVVGVSVGMLFLRSSRLPALSVRAATSLEIGVVAALVFAVSMHSVLPVATTYASAYVPFMAALVWVFAHGKGLISRFFSSRGLVALGEISFAFYMLHWAAIRVAVKLGIYDALPRSLASFGILAVVVCASYVMFRYFEAPLRGKLRSPSSAGRLPTASRMDWQSDELDPREQVVESVEPAVELLVGTSNDGSGS